MNRKYILTIGISVVVVALGLLIRGSHAQDEYGNWRDGQISAYNTEEKENSEKYQTLQPKMERERTRCEISQDLEKQMTTLNIRNNEIRRLRIQLEAMGGSPKQQEL